MSYFASRSAALGTPSPQVVEALFYHFAPALVRRAIPASWQLARPAEILRIRHELAVDAIKNGAGSNIGEDTLGQFSLELFEAARSLPISGRALYAAHLGIDWGDSTELRLFGAATLLREHRGDTHNAALAAHGIDGVQSHLLQIATGAVTHDVIFPTRGWSVEAWNEGFERLVSAGLLSVYSNSQQPILTELGQTVKQRIEAQTDQYSDPWSSMDSSKLARIEQVLRAISELVRDYVGFPAANPIGV